MTATAWHGTLCSRNVIMARHNGGGGVENMSYGKAGGNKQNVCSRRGAMKKRK